MSRTREHRWLWSVLVLAMVGLVVMTALRGRQARLLGDENRAVDATAAAAGGAVAGLADYGQVPDFDFVSQTGERVVRSDLDGQIWIGDFIFTNCASSCPMMNAQLEKLAATVGTDANVRFVSFSVDPERDSPEKLAEYAKGYDAEPERWLFLTGDKQAMRTLVQEGFHLSVQEATEEEIAAGSEPVLHSTRFVLVDGNGHIRGYYNGLDDEAMKQLGVDVRGLASTESQVAKER